MAWSHQELECKWVTFQSSASHTPACLTPAHHHENWASPFSFLHQHTYGSKCRQHMDHHDRHQTTGMVFGNDLAIHFFTMPCAAESCKVASILQHPLVFIASLVFMNKTMGRVSWHNNPYIHCCKALFKDIKLSFCSTICDYRQYALEQFSDLQTEESIQKNSQKQGDTLLCPIPWQTLWTQFTLCTPVHFGNGYS